MNANCDAPVKTRSDRATVCAGVRPAAMASAPNEIAYVPMAVPMAMALRSIVLVAASALGRGHPPQQ